MIKRVTVVESVVRSALAYPREVNGDAQVNDDTIDINPSKDQINMIGTLSAFLQSCSCDIWDLSQFLTVEELVRLNYPYYQQIRYYSFLETHAQELNVSNEVAKRCSWRKEIAIMLAEVKRMKSQRYSLQKVSRSILISNVSSVSDDLKRIVAQQSENANENDRECLCYSSFILGYYCFFQQRWEEASFYWKASHFDAYHWDESTVSVLLDRNAPFSSSL